MGLWPCPPGDIGINTPIYDYPRDVKNVLAPQAANLLSNTLTSFENGFDGVTAAFDPMQPSVNFSCGLTVLYVDPEDPAGIFTVNETDAGSLQVTANGPNATVWFGMVNAWTQPLPTVPPHGWYSNAASSWGVPLPPVPLSPDVGDWFPVEVVVTPPRSWFDDPVNPGTGWFTMNNNFFSIGTPEYQGGWFPAAAQPPQNGNLSPFTVVPHQPFNFSVSADYLSVLDPSNATMEVGFRWYYPDGSWAESYATNSLDQSLERYAFPPSDPTLAWMAYPPPETITQVQPKLMFPFVRFPNAQQAQFLLNSAMLSPGQSLLPLPYMDISMFPGNSDYIEDSHGATYYYKNRDIRTLRLEDELYRWIPMGASHTEIFAASTAVPPLDPTQWIHPGMALHGSSTLTATPS